MREVEAKWFFDNLKDLDANEISPCLNIGSGAVRKEFADRCLFDPLKNLGVKVINVDIKSGGIVDICGDIFDPEVQVTLRSMEPKMLICSNMVEHLPAERLNDFVDALYEIVQENGLVVVAAPFSFPFHPDPIDTYYRPSPEELKKLFYKFDTLKTAVIESDSYADDIKAYSFVSWLKILRRLLKPFRRRNKWKAVAHKFFWLFRNYAHTVAIFKKA